MKQALLSLAVLATMVALYLVIGGQPEAIDPASKSYTELQAGPYTPQWEDIEVVDSSRSTGSVGDFAGSASRQLTVRLWRPDGMTKPGPLVLYSHGFMSNREGATHLAEYLAGHGWLVAAVDFPLSCFPCVSQPTPLDVVNQPADMSFVLDQLLWRNQDSLDPLYRAIDPLRIAGVGYSLGGFTTQLLAYHTEMADSRIKAAVSIAGPSAMLKTDFFRDRHVPFMMIAGTADALVDYQSNAADIIARAPGAVLVSLESGSHAGFNYAARFLRHLSNPDQLVCAMQSEQYSGSEESHWYRRLGGEEQGIRAQVDMSVCRQDPLPEAMNLLRQQQLTLLAVRSFLHCQLEPDTKMQRQQCDYLLLTLPAEFPSVRVEGG